MATLLIHSPHGSILSVLPPDVLYLVTRLLDADDLLRLVYLSGDRLIWRQCMTFGGITELRGTPETSFIFSSLPTMLWTSFCKLTHLSLNGPGRSFPVLPPNWTESLPSSLEKIDFKFENAFSIWISPVCATDDDISLLTNAMDGYTCDALDERFPNLKTLHLTGRDPQWRFFQRFLDRLPPSLTSLRLHMNPVAMTSLPTEPASYLLIPFIDQCPAHLDISKFPQIWDFFISGMDFGHLLIPFSVYRNETHSTDANSSNRSNKLLLDLLKQGLISVDEVESISNSFLRTLMPPFDGLRSLQLDNELVDPFLPLIRHLSSLDTLTLGLQDAALSTFVLPSSLTTLKLTIREYAGSQPSFDNIFNSTPLITTLHIHVRRLHYRSSTLLLSKVPPSLTSLVVTSEVQTELNLLFSLPPTLVHLRIECDEQKYLGIASQLASLFCLTSLTLRPSAEWNVLPASLTSLDTMDNELVVEELDSLPKGLRYLNGSIFIADEPFHSIFVDEFLRSGLSSWDPDSLSKLALKIWMPHIEWHQSLCNPRTLIKLKSKLSRRIWLSGLRTYLPTIDMALPPPPADVSSLISYDISTVGQSCDVSKIPPNVVHLHADGNFFQAPSRLITWSNMVEFISFNRLPPRLRSFTYTRPITFRETVNDHFYPPLHSAPGLTTLHLKDVSSSELTCLTLLPRSITSLTVDTISVATVRLCSLPKLKHLRLSAGLYLGPLIPILHSIVTFDVAGPLVLEDHDPITFEGGITLELNRTTLRSQLLNCLFPPRLHRPSLHFEIEWGPRIIALLPSTLTSAQFWCARTQLFVERKERAIIHTSQLPKTLTKLDISSVSASYRFDFNRLPLILQDLTLRGSEIPGNLPQTLTSLVVRELAASSELDRPISASFLKELPPSLTKLMIPHCSVLDDAWQHLPANLKFVSFKNAPDVSSHLASLPQTIEFLESRSIPPSGLKQHALDLVGHLQRLRAVSNSIYGTVYVIER